MKSILRISVSKANNLNTRLIKASINLNKKKTQMRANPHQQTKLKRKGRLEREMYLKKWLRSRERSEDLQ
jgi:hypothetical protein